MRGRKPLPKNVHLIRGNPSKLSRDQLKDDVNPIVEIPAPPPNLAGEALAEWHRITLELVTIGLVTNIDRAALVMYCESWAQYSHACAKIADLNGELVVQHPNGFKGPSPWLAIRDKAAEQCRKLLTEFGMSPSSRSRVQPSRQLDLFDDENNGKGYFS